MLNALARWVQSTALSGALAGSTWAYPVIGALHVLGIAWFGGAVLLAAMRRGPESREVKGPRPAVLWTGGAVMLLTGAMLFVIEPMRCAESEAFRLKLLLLGGLIVISPASSRIGSAVKLTLWAGVLLASRGIAFF